MLGIKRLFRTIRAFNNLIRNPQAEAWMKIVQGVMDFANEVAKKKQPMMTRIYAINMGVEELPKEMDIVSLWAGVGDANPIVRLGELREQIKVLRELVLEAKDIIPDTEENYILLMNMRMMLSASQ